MTPLALLFIKDAEPGRSIRLIRVVRIGRPFFSASILPLECAALWTVSSSLGPKLSRLQRDVSRNRGSCSRVGFDS